MIAVSFYLLGIVPLLGMALLEIGVISRNTTEQLKLRLHATLETFFLIVAHIAMIFGMVNPMVFA